MYSHNPFRQYWSLLLRRSARPWIVALATASFVFYLVLSSAANVNLTSESQPLIESRSELVTSALPNLRFKSVEAPTTRPNHSRYYEFLLEPIINSHDFVYLHNNPSLCSRKPVDLVIISPSGPANFYRRMRARNSSRAAFIANPANKAIHLFFLGSSTDPDVQKKVASESVMFDDIIQESYIDVYANITYKSVQMLKWVSVFCSQSRNVIRLDDDVEADVNQLLAAMERARSQHPYFILGEVKEGWLPCKIPKCRTTKEEYPYATLPPFALGGALGFSTPSVVRLYEATKRLKRFKLDDVYVTGMCAPRVDVKLLKDKQFVFKHGAW